ncbi:hypothetical protein SUDANB25_02746 [Streptomyces sp. SudanB25_2051]
METPKAPNRPPDPPDPPGNPDRSRRPGRHRSGSADPPPAPAAHSALGAELSLPPSPPEEPEPAPEAPPEEPPGVPAATPEAPPEEPPGVPGATPQAPPEVPAGTSQAPLPEAPLEVPAATPQAPPEAPAGTPQRRPGEPPDAPAAPADPADPAAELRELVSARDRLQGLLDAVMAISGELELPLVLHRIVRTAMDLVHARYGALGVLNEDGTELAEFLTAGLTDRERADLEGVELPRGHGLLGTLIHHPEPLRVDDIRTHPHSVGYPPGHPPMRTLLGVAISVRGEIYGDLYLSDRLDGRPFDAHDQDIVVALAGAAGIAIENARLFERVRSGAERFQRLLLPRLPDLNPYESAAVYRPAASPAQLGGDWYDAVPLPDGACGAVIGDVVGHDLRAAAAMAQTRNMLRALLYDRRTPPSAVLTALDRTLHAITDAPVTTACLARLQPAGDGQGPRLHWSSAGHPPPLLLAPGHRPRYLDAEPGLPLGVDPDQPRPDHTYPLPPGAALLFYTDGLVEHPEHPIDRGLDALAELAAPLADGPLDELCRILCDEHPGDGHDDMAVLALRVPPAGISGPMAGTR